MSESCCGSSCASQKPVADARYRRILIIALLVNLAMFIVEVVAGSAAGSSSLLADALDFLGDAANYGISLYVLGHALVWRARAALLKGMTMAAFGLWVMITTLYGVMQGGVPEAETMGVVSVLALLTNVGVALLLYRYRTGDSNMESVWLCSRNDAIGNIAVMFAAVGVWATASNWPDAVVAFAMACLALSAAVRVISRALQELRDERVLS